MLSRMQSGLTLQWSSNAARIRQEDVSQSPANGPEIPGRRSSGFTSGGWHAMENEMENELRHVKLGLAMVLLSLAFGVALGISFGVNETGYKVDIALGVVTHLELHDEQSDAEIWRYAQRAHFHATGVAAFSLGLVLLTALTGMNAFFKQLAALLVGLSGFYPLSWYVMFKLAPSSGLVAAQEHWLTQLCTFLGVVGLILGTLMVIGNVFFGLFRQKQTTTA